MSSSSFRNSPPSSSQTSGSDFSNAQTPSDESDNGVVTHRPQTRGSTSTAASPSRTPSWTNDFEPGASEQERDRYQGPDKTWLAYTRDERMLSRSLDKLQDRELGLHLLIAHRLRARTRRGRWAPSQRWTAWPIDSRNVPRPSGGVGSGALELELLATTLRLGKEQWRAREERPWKKPKPGSGPDDTDAEPVTTEKGINGENDACTYRSEHDKGPVFTADDDKAQITTRPTVKSLMSRMDGLLTALHHNRAGHHVFDFKDDANADSSAVSGSRSRSRSIRRFWTPRLSADCARTSSSRSPSRDPKDVRGRRRRRSSSTESPEPDSADSTGRAAPVRKRKRRAPRDWSELLGVAAMIGWDPGAVSRTLTRCSVLFDEKMELRRMSEGPRPLVASATTSQSRRRRRSETTESKGIRSEPVISKSEKSVPRSQHHVCPVDLCKRRFLPQRGYRWREHLRRVHKFDTADIAALEGRQDAKDYRRELKNPRNWIVPDPLFCPVQSCNRSTANVFTEPRRLVDHVRKVHKYDPRKESPPRTVSYPNSVDLINDARSSSSGTTSHHTRGVGSDVEMSTDADETTDASRRWYITRDTEPDDFMIGGVHNDGFLQPIPASHGARGRDRSSRDPSYKKASC